MKTYIGTIISIEQPDVGLNIKHREKISCTAYDKYEAKEIMIKNFKNKHEFGRYQIEVEDIERYCEPR